MKTTGITFNPDASNLNFSYELSDGSTLSFALSKDQFSVAKDNQTPATSLPAVTAELKMCLKTVFRRYLEHWFHLQCVKESLRVWEKNGSVRRYIAEFHGGWRIDIEFPIPQVPMVMIESTMHGLDHELHPKTMEGVRRFINNYMAPEGWR